MKTLETLRIENPEAAVFKIEAPVYEGPSYKDFPEAKKNVASAESKVIDLFNKFGVDFKIRVGRGDFTIDSLKYKRIEIIPKKNGSIRICSRVELDSRMSYHEHWDLKYCIDGTIEDVEKILAML